jgi:hypothetical protein
VSSFAWALLLALQLKLGALGAWPQIEPRIIKRLARNRPGATLSIPSFWAIWRGRLRSSGRPARQSACGDHCRRDPGTGVHADDLRGLRRLRLFAASIRDHVISRPRVLIWMRRSFAFVALGAKLALSDR